MKMKKLQNEYDRLSDNLKSAENELKKFEEAHKLSLKEGDFYYDLDDKKIFFVKEEYKEDYFFVFEVDKYGNISNCGEGRDKELKGVIKINKPKCSCCLCCPFKKIFN